MLVMVDGVVYLFEGVFLAAIYVAYILFTIFGERCAPKGTRDGAGRGAKVD